MQGIRNVILRMESQRISQVARLGAGRRDTLPLWFGESDLVTPAFIRDAAKTALDAGHTFYVDRRGIAPLREGLAEHVRGLYGIDLPTGKVTVVGSGMTAIMIAVECLVDNGDNIVVVSPIWPNVVYAINAMGAQSRHVRLRLQDGRWRLDLEALFAACDERTRAIFIASPGNPTGWIMERDEQRAILSFCRARGIWVISDEVYNRIVYDRPVAPSFLEITAPDDPVFVVQSFSKTWAMTGWRLGWLVHPEELGDRIGDLSAINNTGATAFVQHAGLAALKNGESFVSENVARCRAGRDYVYERLAGHGRIDLPERPSGAFYAFFRIRGLTDDLQCAKELFKRSGLGLAPGSAFGPGNEGFLRLCFGVSQQKLSEAVTKLVEAFDDSTGQ